jgi:hypothetical protein
MEESFHFKLRGEIYEVILEEDNNYTIFKMGVEYMLLLKHKSGKWLQIDYKTDQPIIEENHEVDELGEIIERFTSGN